MAIVSPFVIGSFWMSGALASFLMVAIAGRELSDTMNTFQIVFIRSLVGFVIVLVVAGVKGRTLFRTARFKTHLTRNVLHYSAQAGWFLGVSLLPLATVFAIEFTTPIWVALMAVWFLGEKLNRGRWVAILCGFGGTLIILRPGLAVFDVGSMAVLWAAIGFASAYIFTKVLFDSDSPITILLYMTGIQAIIDLVPGLVVWVELGVEDLV